MFLEILIYDKIQITAIIKRFSLGGKHMRFLSRLEYRYRTYKERLGAFVEFNFLKMARQADRGFVLQVWECLWGWLRYGILPKSYYNYRLYERKEPLRKKAKDYVSDRSYFGKLGRVNLRNGVVLSNKWLFHNYFDGYNLPLPKCWGYFHKAGGVWKENGVVFKPQEFSEVFKRMAGETVVIKPSRGSSGARIVVAKILVEAEAVFLLVDDNKIPLEEFAMNFSSVDYIIEERLSQHADLNAIYPNSVNTVRINTLYHPGSIKIWGAIIKLGTGGAPIDNWGKGSLCVGIDIETGQMGVGSRDVHYSKAIVPPFTAHPDTQAQFTGVELPCWQEVKAIVAQAANLLPFLPYIAWDVAITPNGPCIIEGNGRSDLSMVQVHGGLLNQEIKDWWRNHNIKI